MESKAARRYIFRVRRHLVCSSVSRKQLLSQGQKLVTRFESENPEARYDDFVSAFGPPGDFAGEMLSCVDNREVEAAQRRRRRIKRTAIIGLTLVLCVAAIFGFVKWNTYQKIFDQDFTIIQNTPQQHTKEDFFAMIGAE